MHLSYSDEKVWQINKVTVKSVVKINYVAAAATAAAVVVVCNRKTDLVLNSLISFLDLLLQTYNVLLQITDDAV